MVVKFVELEVVLDFEGEILRELGVEDGGFVVLEIGVGFLPVVGIGLSCDFQSVRLDFELFGLVQPFGLAIDKSSNHIL